MADDPSNSDLIAAATNGDAAAWDQLVQRFLPLVYAVIRRYRLSLSDAQDVSQTVWLRLVEHLAELRNPQALPGWISVTTKNEAIRVLKAKGRNVDVDPSTSSLFDQRSASPEVDEGVLQAERRQMLRDGLAELTPKQRELLILLAQEPPLSYEEISRRLNIPIGSIGPTRARYLKILRETDALQTYFPDPVLPNVRGVGR